MIGQALNHNCTDCLLHASSEHVCIRGRGYRRAAIFLIGEAPGSAESLTGRPFMGRAGKLLDQLLIETGTADNTYISNVCHCRPPEDRKPTELEIKTCQKYLIYELNQVKPKVIVLLGKTAMRFVELSGHCDEVLSAGTKPFRLVQFHGLKNLMVVPTWHPAYCLRRGDGATNDLRRALSWAKIKAS